MKKMCLHAAQQCTITRKLVGAKDAMLEGKLSLHSQLGIYYDGFSYGPSKRVTLDSILLMCCALRTKWTVLRST